jgi:hypothetical protein
MSLTRKILEVCEAGRPSRHEQLAACPLGSYIADLNVGLQSEQEVL